MDSVYNKETFFGSEHYPLNRIILGHNACSWSVVVGDTIQFQAFEKPPNAWWRFWQWLLLGWKWESREESSKREEQRWRQRYGTKGVNWNENNRN